MPGQQVITSQIVTPTIPWVFDISNDPKELWNIAAANTWIGVPMARIGVEYQKSIAKFPNILPVDAGPEIKQ